APAPAARRARLPPPGARGLRLQRARVRARRAGRLRPRGRQAEGVPVRRRVGGQRPLRRRGRGSLVDVLVPLKRLDLAKSRLAERLEPEARARLMRALLDRTLRAAAAA